MPDLKDTQALADERWMAQALEMADRAESEGEVPVGAVLVRDGEIIARGWNRNIGESDATAHAEIIAMREASQQSGNHRLPGSTLYVSLEPCVMCAGAMIHARVDRLVFGAVDPKTGAAGGCFDLLADERHNHKIEVSGRCLEAQCSEKLKAFFRARRKTGHLQINE